MIKTFRQVNKAISVFTSVDFKIKLNENVIRANTS